MILDEIFSKNKEVLERKKADIPFKELEKKALNLHKIPKNVAEILRKNQNKLNIIAEVKKASPSKGVLRQDFNPVQIAKTYEQNEVSMISVLTEEFYFQGNLSYLKEISQAVQTPLLRKDFIFDEYQIAEAFLNGADCILFIAKMLDKEALLRLAEFARALNLHILFEIHNEAELEKVLFAKAEIIGINQRNLNDFSVDTKLCERLMKILPKECIAVAESGLDDKNTLLRLDEMGVDAFLIGEYFMRQNELSRALSEFVKR